MDEVRKPCNSVCNFIEMSYWQIEQFLSHTNYQHFIIIIIYFNCRWVVVVLQ
jgi:hypothetical protein